MKFKEGDWITPGDSIADAYKPGPYKLYFNVDRGLLCMDLMYKAINSGSTFGVYTAGNENTIEHASPPLNTWYE